MSAEVAAIDTMVGLRHARVLFRHLWVVLVFLGLWVGSEKAWASPSVGQRFTDSILTERGYQIPLPPGQWEATATKTENEIKSVVLANKDEQAKIPFMVVRYSAATKSGHWPDACTLSFENLFWRSRHGTQASQNLQKCQLAYLDIPQEVSCCGIDSMVAFQLQIKTSRTN